MTLNQILYNIMYSIKTFILRQEIPYMFGLQINDKCNLNCFYCEGKNSSKVYLKYEEAIKILYDAYNRGNRSLYITGGEPTLWTDNDKTLSDIVDYAYSLGFFNVLIVTNGTQPLSIPNVSYLITIDGPRRIHNNIRNNSYDSIIDNVRKIKNAKVFVTITISKNNYHYINDYIIEMDALNVFNGILFNTLTHWPEILIKYGLSQNERNTVLDNIWHLKKNGYPIILSKAAYKAFKKNAWKRPIHQVELSVGNILYHCCRDINNKEICMNCGYLGCIEISQIIALKLSALLEVLKLT